jgi:protein-disulfide isomerase
MAALQDAKQPAGRVSRPSRSAIVDAVASLILVFATGLVMWSAHGKLTTADSTVGHVRPLSGTMAIGQAATLGSSDARVVIIEFSDFQCPYCAQFAIDVFPLIKHEFIDPGKAKFIFRNMPLRSHKAAQPAAVAAECARRQGRFWEMHDILYRNQMAFAEEYLRKDATEIGLQLDEFDSCVAAPGKAELIADIREATRLGLNVTPTFLIGVNRAQDLLLSKKITGSQPYAVFKQVLEEVVDTKGFHLRRLFSW